MKVLTKESIEELREENENLRNAVQRMKTASDLVLETIRDQVLNN